MIAKNLKRMIPLAEEIKCPFAMQALFDMGLINETNIKAMRKKLAESDVPEIAALSERFMSDRDRKKINKQAAAEEVQPSESVEPLAAVYREKLAAMENIYPINMIRDPSTKFPVVTLRDGTAAPDELLRFIIASYAGMDCCRFHEEADKAAALLSYESLTKAVACIKNNMADSYLKYYLFLVPFLCRYGNCETIENILKDFGSFNDYDYGSVLDQIIRSSIILSDTCTAAHKSYHYIS